MTPQEWPIAAEAADENAPARFAGSSRLATVRRDFFLDPAKRLTEQERALMTAMLHCLVGDVADAIRAALPNGRTAANDDGNAALIAALSSSDLLDEPGLMALLLRRADEERIATAARARSGRREARVLQGLVSHDYGAVAAAAMALILGRGRRRDRFGQCLVAFDDLPDDSAEALAYVIAAAMRAEFNGRAATNADSDLSEAASRVIDQRDQERGTGALTAALVHFLDEAGGLTDDLILAAAHEGEISFVAELLARRVGVSADSALEELLSGQPDHVMALFRVGGLSRDLSAGLLAGVGDLLGIDDAGAAITSFDAMTDSEARERCSWLATTPAYRAALDRLGQGRG
jgi:hypothetical protein